MKTRWSDRINPDCPLPEYPRPQLVRDNWLNLNGRWRYAITSSEICPAVFDGEIIVPFSPESELSGVGRQLRPGQYLWYRRTVRLTEAFRGKRVLLHFGAVDRETCVWVNKTEVVRHSGGYLPFECDISHAVEGESFTLTVRVSDDTDASYHTRGKQSSRRGGIWYTPQSGIWQTVWLEAVPEKYIKKLDIMPDFDKACVKISAETDGEAAYAHFAGNSYELPACIPVPDFMPWSPEQPKLYEFRVTCGADEVQSYFAMRKFSVERDSAGIMRLFLNNKPYFHNGLLDQGYWSDGLYTAPCDEALIFDIETAKKMGFNTLRKHIKVEPLRWYYHCDRLGMLVWQDMPSGGGQYKPAVISTPVALPIKLRDNKYSLFAREDREGREEFKNELRETILHLRSCPCIALWVPFNEGWGQFDSREVYELIRSLDVSRTIDPASGWYDQGIGEVRTDHVYFKKYRFRPDKLGRAVLLSEFGGYNYLIKGHSFNNRDFGYRKFRSAEELAAALKELYQCQLLPAVSEGLSGAIYTQLSDVEDEVNGLISYDRKVLKISPEAIKDICNIEY